MQTQARTTQTNLEDAIAASQTYLLSIQYLEGYWWAELESNVTIAVERAS